MLGRNILRFVRSAALVSCLGFLVGAAGTLSAEDAARKDEASTDERTAMARRIDELLANGWKEAGVKPAPLASDAEFLRRIYLDLTGRVPRVSEARAFLADDQPDKRQRLIDRLLGIAAEPKATDAATGDHAAVRPQYASHFAAVWRGFLLPSDADLRRFGGGLTFENWLRTQFADNVPYDRTVRELLLAEGQVFQTGPGLFYATVGVKPEELASATSRALLGVQIGCAQCHDHPFDVWSQRDFWSYAAFFARLEQPRAQQQIVTVLREVDEGEVKLPETDEVVAPRYLGGETLAEGESNSRRRALADWMTDKQNPYFARAAVNRVWAQLFGRGLVEPVDDLGQHNLPSHGELFDELASHFVESGFDLRELIRVLASTRAYQLSSAAPGDDAPRSDLFAVMSVKPLTAEQLYDSLETAACRRANASVVQRGFAAGRGFDQRRQAFLNKFAAPAAAATEYQAGIPQALSLMNGEMIGEAVDVTRSDLLLALDAPFLDDEQRVETLFLATLSRMPTVQEREKFVEYVTHRESPPDKQAALGDVLWALLNSAEFALNH
ncbi:MAG: DUF1549 and DUF1553 domain-containing protein [Pirellulaceae bacterium]